MRPQGRLIYIFLEYSENINNSYKSMKKIYAVHQT